MKIVATVGILLSLILLGIGASRLWNFLFEPDRPNAHTTFIYKDKRYPPPDTIPNIKEAVPETTIKYTKPDTELRAKIENSPKLPVDVVISNGKLDYTTIDSKGFLTHEVFEYDPDVIKSIRIDQTGSVEIKKRTKMGRFIRRSGKWIIAGAAVAGAFIIGYAFR